MKFEMWNCDVLNRESTRQKFLDKIAKDELLIYARQTSGFASASCKNFRVMINCERLRLTTTYSVPTEPCTKRTPSATSGFKRFIGDYSFCGLTITIGLSVICSACPATCKRSKGRRPTRRLLRQSRKTVYPRCSPPFGLQEGNMCTPVF